MLDKNKQILIIGGGIVGCSTAYFLSRSGYYNVTVIEAVGVAHAASGRAGGFLANSWDDMTSSLALGQRGFVLHEELSKELGPDIGYRKLKTLSLDLREDAVVGPSASGAHVPSWVDGRVNSVHVIDDHDRTAQVHPALLTRALMAKACEKGVSLVNKKAVGLSYSDEHIRSVLLEDQEALQGDVVVLAMGPWTGLGLVWLNKPNVVTGLRAHSILFKVKPGDVDDTALFLEYNDTSDEAHEPEIYPRPDGTVYICGRNDEEPLPEDPACVQQDPEACKKLVEIAHKVSSKFFDTSEATASACYVPLCRDKKPLIGKVPGYEGIYVASGLFCWGILQGPPTGEALAEFIVTGEMPEILKEFDPIRLIG